MTRQCDYFILGSGISGMTLALLFASSGSKVILAERANTFGGAMQRFRRNGVPMDTGFHFTGGMTGCFGDMLEMLGIADDIKTLKLKQQIYFSNSGKCIELPPGLDALEEYLCKTYPEQKSGIEAYFRCERKVYEQTPLFHLDSELALYDGLPDLDEDYITLDAFLDQHNIHGELRGILCAVCSCHGTPPGEISFANHARIHYGLSHDPLRIERGGEAVVEAFLRRAEELGITLLKNSTVKSWSEADARGNIHSAEMSDGSVITFENLIFTQHPKEILQMLPPDRCKESFVRRVHDLEDTCGFFTWYGVLDEDVEGFEEVLCSCLSSPDLNEILSPENLSEHTAGFVCSFEEKSDGSRCRCVTAFQNVFPEETAQFADSCVGKRPDGYKLYKEQRAQEIQKLLFRIFPHFQGKIKEINTASMLTFRDYLYSSGSAYGVKQKLGQENIFGRLPVRNFYTSSQSSILPGAVGSMLTALILFRILAGEEKYRMVLGKIKRRLLA